MGEHRRGEKVVGSPPAASPDTTAGRKLRQRRRALRARIGMLERAVGAELYRGNLDRAGQLVSLRHDLLRRLAALRIRR
jgi:hypothetical protein